MTICKKTLFFFCLALVIFSPFRGKIQAAQARFSQNVNFKSKKLLKITIIDVWQGDSIFLQFPNGHNALIDAGEGKTEYSVFDAPTIDIYPFLKRNNISKTDIQYFVATHPHHDHIGGAPEILKNFNLKTIYDSGMAYTTENYLDFLKILDKKHVQYIIPKVGSFLKWDKDVSVQVLHSGDKHYPNPNNNSIVLKIKYKNFAIILTGDAEKEAEEDILNTGINLNTTILKAAHHGSDTSCSDDFLDQTSPQVIVISVGLYNKFGHPVPSTIEKFKNRNYKIYRTDQNGNINIITDGQTYTIKTEK